MIIGQRYKFKLSVWKETK